MRCDTAPARFPETLEAQLRETKDLGEKFRVLGFCELVLKRIAATLCAYRAKSSGTVSLIPKNFRVGAVKFVRFGKIIGKSDACTPNHWASVAPY